MLLQEPSDEVWHDGGLASAVEPRPALVHWWADLGALRDNPLDTRMDSLLEISAAVEAASSLLQVMLRHVQEKVWGKEQRQTLQSTYELSLAESWKYGK